MSYGSAFPVRETITKAAAVSYVAVRTVHILTNVTTIPDIAIRLIVAVVVEMPLFVILCALSINVLLLNIVVPKIARFFRKVDGRTDRRSDHVR